MKLFFAGIFNYKETCQYWIDNFPIRRVLVSFAYKKDLERVTDEYNGNIDSVFLDCGAYTAFTKGKHIDIDEYGRYVEENGVHFEYIASLDDLKDETKTKENWIYLRDKYPTYEFLPVWHAGESWELLEFYLSHSPSLVLLGGMAMKSFRESSHLDNIFSWIFTRYPYNYHAFGINNTELILRWPFYSCDASTWVVGGKFGEILAPDGKGRFKVGKSGIDRNDEIVAEWLREEFGIIKNEDGYYDYQDLSSVNVKILYDLLEGSESKMPATMEYLF